MDYITEPEKKVRVSEKADLFVAGGSCTGVFAAVKAARRGLKVVLAERLGCLGGTATGALVGVWHSLKDAEYKEQIIGGLTSEMFERLCKSGDADFHDNDPSVALAFNPFTLAYELDRFVAEEKITVLLHTICVGAVTEGKKITAALIENKDGRTAVSADFFIDATGDGDLAKYLGMKSYRLDTVQPPTPCFLMQGNFEGINIDKMIKETGAKYGLPDDFGWSAKIPGLKDTVMFAYFHVFNRDCASAKDLSVIETEGRRFAFSMVKMLNDNTDRRFSVGALPFYAGIRESRHFETDFKATAEELLAGRKYEDAILNGTYRVDTHDEKGDIVHKYLDGRAFSMSGAERNTVMWRWREETSDAPMYYQVPFGILVQREYDNIIAAGRMINADRDAFGALRVMVNLNQIGEAAGIAGALCVESGRKLTEISGRDVRKQLCKAGSAL